MNPFDNEVNIDMNNAERALTKEELQIFNILIGKIQDYEEKEFEKRITRNSKNLF